MRHCKIFCLSDAKTILSGSVRDVLSALCCCSGRTAWYSVRDVLSALCCCSGRTAWYSVRDVFVRCVVAVVVRRGTL